MITIKRPVVRETSFIDYRTRKPYIIKLEVGGKVVRVKRKAERSWYTVTVEQIVKMGAMNRAQEIKAEKKAKREARRKEREGN